MIRIVKKKQEKALDFSAFFWAVLTVNVVVIHIAVIPERPSGRVMNLLTFKEIHAFTGMSGSHNIW